MAEISGRMTEISGNIPETLGTHRPEFQSTKPIEGPIISATRLKFWRQTVSPETLNPRTRALWVQGGSPGRGRPRRLGPGCGAAPARLALRSGATRRVRLGSAPSGVWGSGSAGAQQGTLHPGHLTPGVAALPPRPRRHRAQGVSTQGRGR